MRKSYLKPRPPLYEACHKWTDMTARLFTPFQWPVEKRDEPISMKSVNGGENRESSISVKKVFHLCFFFVFNVLLEQKTAF